MEPFVYIIVLNWNNYPDTEECLTSINELEYSNSRILVVDNASTDGSMSRIMESFPEVETIQNDDNLGFATGNNVGIQYALSKGAEYVLILNNDTIVDKYMLSRMLEYPQRENSIMAPKVYYHAEPNKINSLGTKMNWFRLRPEIGSCGQTDIGQFDRVLNVDILVGCALLISRRIIKNVGLFDEAFCMIHEDADLCLRNIEAGNNNTVIPGAIMYHKASATLGKHSEVGSYYSIRNFLYLTRKRASFLNKIKVYCGLAVLIMKNWFWICSGSDRARNARAFWAGIVDYFTGKMGVCRRVL